MSSARFFFWLIWHGKCILPLPYPYGDFLVYLSGNSSDSYGYQPFFLHVHWRLVLQTGSGQMWSLPVCLYQNFTALLRAVRKSRRFSSIGSSNDAVLGISGGLISESSAVLMLVCSILALVLSHGSFRLRSLNTRYFCMLLRQWGCKIEYCWQHSARSLKFRQIYFLQHIW